MKNYVSNLNNANRGIVIVVKRSELLILRPRPHVGIFVLKSQLFFSFSKKQKTNKQNNVSIRSVIKSFLPVHTNTLYRFENVKKTDCACAAHARWELAKDAPSLERKKKRCFLFTIAYYIFGPSQNAKSQ